MKEKHVRYHFVPKSYLKNWQNSGGKICVYKVLVEHQRVPMWAYKSVSAVAYWSHLYTRFVSGQDDDEFELWFDQEFEAPAEPVVQKVINNQRLTIDDWVTLIRFLAAQDVRTPRRLFEHLRRLHDVLPEALHDVMADFTERVTQEDFPSFIKSAPNDYANLFPFRLVTNHKAGEEFGTIKAESYVGRASWLFSIKHQLASTVKVLQKHKWTIVSPAHGYSWFTSDTPVVRINDYGNGQYDLRGGWGNPNGNIFFPLGPKHAMFVQIGSRSFNRGTKLTEDLTQKLLKFTAENSHRMIFSNSIDQNIPQLKPRTVDADRLKREYQKRKFWHDENTRLEMEFDRKRST